MANLDTVGDTLVLATTYPGTKVDIAMAGTYNMVILFQTEVGSPGSGAWQTLMTFSTANATVAESYYTERHNERVRLIVDVDTSGDVDVFLTDVTETPLVTQYGPRGQELYTIYESGTMLLVNPPITLTAETTLVREKHAGRKLFLDNASGFKVHLPEATGSGDEYHFYVVTTNSSSNVYEINAFETHNDDINGVIVGVDASGDEFTWGADSTENMIQLGGSSQAKGGTASDQVTLVDLKAGLWHARGTILQGGSEVTPFGTDS